MNSERKILIYTFRTNIFKDKLKESFPDIFVFGKLKEDIAFFKDKLFDEEPKFVIGFATAKTSQFERFAVNRFNNKTIINDKPEKFNLFIPDDSFNISKGFTHSFCNWTIYQISNLIHENNLDTKLIFVHLEEKDSPKMIALIKKLIK